MGGLFDKGGRVDENRGFGHITGEGAARASGCGLDLVDDIHATDHFAKHGVARCLRSWVKKVVVAHVDEKLCRGGIRVIGTGHRQCANDVFVAAFGQCLAALMQYRWACRLLRVGGIKAAALDHEVVDHAVKHRAVVVFVLDVLQEILDGYRSGIRIQGIAIKQADPPTAVNDAFKAVSAAQQTAQTYLNEARAAAQQVTAKAQGEAAAFDKVYEQYRLSPDVTRRRMYYETMEGVLSNVDKTIVEGGNVTPYLPLPEIKRRAQQAATPAPAANATGGQ